MTKINNLYGVGSALGSLARFSPEPRSRSGFQNAMRGIGDAFGTMTSIGGIDPLYVQLINEQIRVQQQMQLVSFQSNIEKSKHETQMAAVRNLRVG